LVFGLGKKALDNLPTVTPTKQLFHASMERVVLKQIEQKFNNIKLQTEKIKH